MHVRVVWVQTDHGKDFAKRKDLCRPSIPKESHSESQGITLLAQLSWPKLPHTKSRNQTVILCGMVVRRRGEAEEGETEEDDS